MLLRVRCGFPRSFLKRCSGLPITVNESTGAGRPDHRSGMKAEIRMTETLTLCLIAAVGLITGVWWRIYILIALTPLAWAVSYLAAPYQEYSTYATIGFVIGGGMILQIFYFIGTAIRVLSQMQRKRFRAFAWIPESFQKAERHTTTPSE